MSTAKQSVRLDRLLGNRGYCSRSSVDDFLKLHDVRVGETRMSRGEHKVTPDSVTIDGQPVDRDRLVLLMNKPVGVTCSHKEKGPLVYDLLPQRWRSRNPPVTSVGRLDKETSGLLILTDDGDLVHRLTSPKKHVPRVYLATLREPIKGDEQEIFESGKMMLEDDDKPLLPAQLDVVSESVTRVTVHEGRYHQVRRMFAMVGNHVESLHRERFGDIELDSLQAGEWKELKDI